VWPDVDQGLKAYLLRRWNPVRPPDVFLPTTLIDQSCLTVGMKRSTASQETLPEVNGQFDINTKCLKHFIELLLG
jgi:hypothetical protein